MFSLTGNLAGATVDTTVEVHEDNFHLNSALPIKPFNNFTGSDLILGYFCFLIQRVDSEYIRSLEMEGHKYRPRRGVLTDVCLSGGITPSGNYSYLFA